MRQTIIMCMVLYGCVKKQTPIHNESTKTPVAQISDSSDPVVAVFDKSAIDARIKNYMSDIQSCYEKALKNDSAVSGRIVMSFDIGQKGNVVNLAPKDDSLNSPQCTQCLVDVFSKMQFPAGMQSDIVQSDGTTKKNVSVSYPLLFSPK